MNMMITMIIKKKYNMWVLYNMNTTEISVIIIGLILGYISTSGVKTQKIRILDILVIGPLMIYFGASYQPANFFSLLLVFFGATTMTYNLKNYLHAKN